MWSPCSALVWWLHLCICSSCSRAEGQLLIPCSPVSFPSCATMSSGTLAPSGAHTRNPACLRLKGPSEWVQEGWTLLPPKDPLAIVLCSSAPSHKCRAGHKPTWDLESKRPGSQPQRLSVKWRLQRRQEYRESGILGHFHSYEILCYDLLVSHFAKKRYDF